MSEEIEKGKSRNLLIVAISLLANASLVNILIGLECIDFNPDKEFLKWSNYLAFAAIAGLLDKHIDIKTFVTKLLGNRFKINK